MQQSPLYTINWRDISRGLIIAIATPVAVAMQRLLDAGKMDFSWKALLMIGIGGGLSYLVKNFFTAPAEQPVIQKVTE